MARYRQGLPQLDGARLFLADGGLETALIFHRGIELPFFASFDLLRSEAGRAVLREYFAPFVEAARDGGYGFVIDSANWRANPDWGAKLGYSRETLAKANREGIALACEIRATYEAPDFPIVVSGTIGPRGDGYDPGKLMSPAEAEDYHREQIAVYAGTEADMIGAFTMTNTAEAIGIARAARASGMPVMISFTLETDGRLPTGQSLRDAISETDAATDMAPAYYCVNCAHPSHVEPAFGAGGDWLMRLRGLRANASRRSHAELDSAPDLDAGDPVELAGQYAELRRRLPQITLLGGCCGTDHRHVRCIAEACRQGTPGAEQAPRDVGSR